MGQRLKIVLLDAQSKLERSLAQHVASQTHDIIHVIDVEGLDELLARTDIHTVVVAGSINIDDSVTLITRLRATRPNLVLILLIDTDAQDLRIRGYDSGADVCISGSSLNAELLAVIQNISRRMHLEQMTLANVTLNSHRRELEGSDAVALNVVELTLLKALAQAPDRQMAYFRMLELFDTEVDAKAKAALEVHIARLRKKLVDAGVAAPAIRAIRNEGYQLIEPVRIA
jgi:DNA-binding response OmpR family regulator